MLGAVEQLVGVPGAAGLANQRGFCTRSKPNAPSALPSAASTSSACECPPRLADDHPENFQLLAAVSERDQARAMPAVVSDFDWIPARVPLGLGLPGRFSREFRQARGDSSLPASEARRADEHDDESIALRERVDEVAAPGGAHGQPCEPPAGRLGLDIVQDQTPVCSCEANVEGGKAARVVDRFTLEVDERCRAGARYSRKESREDRRECANALVARWPSRTARAASPLASSHFSARPIGRDEVSRDPGHSELPGSRLSHEVLGGRRDRDECTLPLVEQRSAEVSPNSHGKRTPYVFRPLALDRLRRRRNSRQETHGVPP